GEDTIVICHKCRYTANRQIARFQKSPLPPEKLKKVARISTPGARTIDELSTFLNVPKAKIAKAILLVATITEEEKDREHFVFAVVRGDMELSETKLTNILKAKELRPALDSEIQAVGAAPGYASPVNHREPHNNADLIVVVDDVIPDSPNLIAGANDDGYHLRHVNYGRDFKADIVTDIVSAPDGGRCPDCGELMLTKRGIEVGNIFKLGTRYSDALGCTFLDKDGKEKAVIMGSYGIGSGRLLGAIAEEHNDKNGFIWPITVAPYQVHLLELFKKNKTGPAVETAKNLYRDLQAAGIEVLYDDRDESPGVKFNDVDLIGVPIRLTVSQRSLREGGVEWKLRRSGEKKIIAIGEAVEAVKSVIAHLNDEIEKKVTRVDFAG
ncbi:MAG: YbaK/EbsC family protein, partial [Calditrichia bacterium]